MLKEKNIWGEAVCWFSQLVKNGCQHCITGSRNLGHNVELLGEGKYVATVSEA